MVHHAEPPATTRADEERLLRCIERIIQRDQEALAELYDATINRVHGAALRIVENIEATEEVVSDVYFQVWRGAQRYDRARGSVQGWLLTMCRNRALDALRRRDPAVVHPKPRQRLVSETGALCDLQDLMEATRSCSQVHDALAKLSPLQRQFLALAFFRASTPGEIALHFEMPLGGVEAVIGGAVRKMRGVFSEPPSIGMSVEMSNPNRKRDR